LVTEKPPKKNTLIFHLFEKKVAAKKALFQIILWVLGGGLFWTDGSQQLASSHLSAVGFKKDGVEDKSLTWKTNHDPLFF
jgi:hypothetical protein